VLDPFTEVMQKTKMRKIYYGVIGLAAMCATQTAMAQDDHFDVTPTNIAVRLGVGLPLDSALSDYGSPLIGFGVEYQFPNSLLSSGATYLSLDYLVASTEFNGGIFPLCINQRFYFNQNKSDSTRTYGFLGIGAAIVNIGSSNTVLAGRGGFGADLGPAIFFESALLLTDKQSGVSGDSVSFYIGYRF
jgi:hypothetical protein